MSICRLVSGRWDGRLQALSHKTKDGTDLLARHVELLHHFIDAQVFEVLNDRGDGQPGIPEHPGPADLAGNARSEERRVGKECRSRWSPDHQKMKAGAT